MKILITAAHYPVASGRYMHDAFKRLGYDVKSVGPSMGLSVWGIVAPEKHEWVPDNPPANWTPDLVVHMDGNWAPPERIGDCPHVVYGVDNHVRDYRRFENTTRDDWDHLFLAHSFGHRVNEDSATWLPCAYDPHYFKRGPKLRERRLDAAMIGVMYGQRASMLYAIRAHLPAAKMAYETGPMYHEYADIYCNAKVALCLSAARDVAIRVFEGAAMGCVVLTDNCHDLDALGLESGKNCVVFNSIDEVPHLIKATLDAPKRAQTIANAGAKWAADHTWDHRAAYIAEWAAGQKPKKRRKVKSDDSSDN
jgi:hypothetical protein